MFFEVNFCDRTTSSFDIRYFSFQPNIARKHYSYSLFSIRRSPSAARLLLIFAFVRMVNVLIENLKIEQWLHVYIEELMSWQKKNFCQSICFRLSCFDVAEEKKERPKSKSKSKTKFIIWNNTFGEQIELWFIGQIFVGFSCSFLLVKHRIFQFRFDDFVLFSRVLAHTYTTVEKSREKKHQRNRMRRWEQ